VTPQHAAFRLGLGRGPAISQETREGTIGNLEATITLTPELKQAVRQAGEEPVRVEDPETHTAYLVIREDVYRRIYALAAIDHPDRSLFEFDEFHPDRDDLSS
jgi:hypothetical protein